MWSTFRQSAWILDTKESSPNYMRYSLFILYSSHFIDPLPQFGLCVRMTFNVCVCVCSFLTQPNGRILKKAGEKLKRLNDFYDNMDKKTRKESRAQIKTPLQQVRSVFPRRSHAHKSGASTMPHAHDMNPSIATSETAFGRYVQRRSIAEPNSRQATEGHTNFAWIDWENRIDVCAWRRTHTTYNEYENKKF